jgi:hypothetical protein
MVLLLPNNVEVRSAPDNLEGFLYSSEHIRRDAHDFREKKKVQMSEGAMEDKGESW